jgi:hypothetical protein
MYGDSGGFDQRTLLHAHVLGELVAVVLGQCVIPGERAIVGRCRRKSHVGTKVVFALLAAHAATARDTRLHGDLVTDL